MQGFERRLLLPYARGLFNLYGLLGFLVIIFGVGAVLWGFTQQDEKTRVEWLNSNDDDASNARMVAKDIAIYFDAKEEEQRIEKYTGYMMNDPNRISLPVEKSEYGACLSKSTYQPYTYIDNPEKRDTSKFPWSVWRPNEFAYVLKDKVDIDPGVVGKDFITEVCKLVSSAGETLKPKHVATNTSSGYSPWMDLGYRIEAISYAEARFKDYRTELTATNIQKESFKWIGLWSIGVGSGMVAVAALIISFMGIESNLRRLEDISDPLTPIDRDRMDSD